MIPGLRNAKSTLDLQQDDVSLKPGGTIYCACGQGHSTGADGVLEAFEVDIIFAILELYRIIEVQVLFDVSGKENLNQSCNVTTPGTSFLIRTL